MNPADPQHTESAWPVEIPPSTASAAAEELPYLAECAGLEPEVEPPREGGPGGAAAAEVETGKSAGGELPPAGKPVDRKKLYAAVGAGVAAFLVLMGAASLWRAHSELGTLRRELDALKVQSKRAQVQQERAAVLRVRAELQGLRQTVPADLAAEVDKADAALTSVDERLKALQ